MELASNLVAGGGGALQTSVLFMFSGAEEPLCQVRVGCRGCTFVLIHNQHTPPPNPTSQPPPSPHQHHPPPHPPERQRLHAPQPLGPPRRRLHQPRGPGAGRRPHRLPALWGVDDRGLRAGGGLPAGGHLGAGAAGFVDVWSLRGRARWARALRADEERRLLHPTIPVLSPLIPLRTSLTPAW
jgi:hypothetical protein